MFKILDGRSHFYQWDYNQKLIVSDPSVKEVHFCNRTDDCSLIVEVKDGLAEVPNILLQNAWTIRAYAYCGDYTKVEEKFKVVARSKPSDYVYTETEIKNYDDLKAEIEWLKENGIAPDLRDYPTWEQMEREINGAIDNSGLATEDYVDRTAQNLKGYTDDAIANLEIPEGSGKDEIYIGGGEMPEGYSVQIDPYAEVPEKDGEYVSKDEMYSAIEEMKEGLATEEYVDSAIANIDIPTGGSSGFRLIRDITIPEDITTDTSDINYIYADDEQTSVLFGFDTDTDGNAFELTELILVTTNAGTIATTDNVARVAFDSEIPKNSSTNGIAVYGVTKNSGTGHGINQITLLGDGNTFTVKTNFGGGTNNAVQSSAKPQNMSVNKISKIRMGTQNANKMGFTIGSQFRFYGR